MKTMPCAFCKKAPIRMKACGLHMVRCLTCSFQKARPFGSAREAIKDWNNIMTASAKALKAKGIEIPEGE